MGKLCRFRGRVISRTECQRAIVTRCRGAGALLMSVVLAVGFGPVGVRAQIFPTAPPPSSGVNWPPDPGAVRAAAEADLEQSEKEVAALVAAQAPDFGAGSADEKVDTTVRNAAIVFERVVRPRLGNASVGCHEAQLGLMAWFSYWRPLQEAGIEDSPDVFPMLDGKARTGEFDLPKRVLETYVGVCASEAHDRCVATGDFVRIFEGLVLLQRSWEALLGQEMPAGWVDAFVRGAKACGQWTLSVRTDFTEQGLPKSCCGIQGKMHRDIRLRWEPNGSGIGNIFYSTIVGESDVIVDTLDFTSSLCDKSHGSPAQVEQAKAKILGLVFDQSGKGPVTPRHVWLAIQFGEVDTTYSARCPEHINIGPAEWPADELEVSPLLLYNRDARRYQDEDIHGLLINDNRAFSSEPDVPSLWTFSSTPFRADLDVSRADSPIYGSRGTRLTLRLTHTPH